ncbi:juvenile hormone epoxide hydrolase-like [Achroia grisella]|uniref:juvenile hormone epoxide hydrolase-like n=1 Tax=Achroia grisella TaxID=688607 RepID=UPI0027D27C6F|nr:juvenile hormone epoxide hydrolase-like [Achroia grisella]
MSQPAEDKSINDKKKPDSACNTVNVVVFLTAVVVGIFSYYVYNTIRTPPKVPQFDIDQWWGPYPINLKRDLSIRPFKIEFTDVIVNDLKERLLHRREFIPPLDDAGFTYGFNSHFLNEVLNYWQNKYNFKDREQFLNKYNHFKTNIQGLDIHFVHVKPKVTEEYEVVPLLLLHGWPGSFREFYEMIPKLVTPRPGYKFIFELIIPSLPGYGYSQAPSRRGLGPAEIAIIMRNLMHRIGHKHYYIQGGDIGHNVGSIIATLFQDEVLGFHTNMPILLFHPIATVYTLLGSFWPRLVVEAELKNRMYPIGQHFQRQLEESGYLHIQGTKPDTIGAALTDSPTGLAAYILEKFSTWTNNEYKKAADGKLLMKYSLTHLLDNVMIYWATNSITTSMRLYAEFCSKRNMALKLDEIPTNVPTWGIKFKHELMFHPDSLLRLKYKKYLHSTIVEDGGHFAALEMPDILADDIYKAVDTFIEYHNIQNAKQELQLQPNYEKAKTVYEFTAKNIDGKEVKLEKYKGHVLVIVNVASQCGLTDVNYEQLNQLYEKYAITKGLRILAFPCNQFNSQEPGTHREIFSFVKKRDVKFDVFEKIDVNGDNAHPLWQFLKRTQSGIFGDFIKWNFSKFIVDKNGVPVERLGPNVNPVDLEPLLAKYW